LTLTARLTGARLDARRGVVRLHREVLAGVERLRDRLGHLDLAAPLAATKRGDRLG